jgi:hypothetical protein
MISKRGFRPLKRAGLKKIVLNVNEEYGVKESLQNIGTQN